ncbi:CDP-alcohol phosphatidyltransferase family protein [Rhodococcus antarcticus]|jgi:CDP-diacylglycerol--glycerol-3-phosphate 3-phosphatidyltransferase|uniref:Phosphatidylinositol phosphate synthase n=1 Tax=Rhodococcus antarcticus TaxID=2987751 RepID=A0ABY6P440_9NOCA|nr:CDP-alcohol phosphatidyltransferase family protein [Rhodococcus antarcticus]UZJ26091.1 CDP-alcohol phosphatidyltransferase family protein [Rhodococcus antarcticus]
MVKLITRSSASRVTGPIGSWLVRRGLSPDAMTVIGTVLSVVSALTLFTTDHLFVGTLLIWLFVMFDMLDGAMARAQGGGTRFGAVLDATCDRVTDGAIFASLTWWAFTYAHSRPLAAAALVCLITSQVTSYAKARAEASGFAAPKGLIERPSRLVIVLAGTGLTGLGLPWAVYVGTYVLAVGSVYTVVQRVLAVRNAEGARDRIPL